MWSQLFFGLLVGADRVELNHEMGVADGVLPFVPRSLHLTSNPHDQVKNGGSPKLPSRKDKCN